MSKSRPFSIRIDEDLLKVINQHTSVNRNAYIENLILRGLMLDLNDTIEKMEKRIEYDLEYIREWSIWFDLKIIFLTIFKGFIHKTAY